MKLIRQAQRNAVEALDRRLAETTTQGKILRDMADLFGLDGPPDRIEIYDNSHIQGTNALGAMVVAGPGGFRKNAHRMRSEEATAELQALMRNSYARL